MAATEARNARWALLVAVLGSVALYAIPQIRMLAWPLMLFSTFAHEMGHGLTALVMGGDFQSFQMWADGSGVATHSGVSSALGRAAVSAGGLLGPAALSAVFFGLGSRTRLARAGLAFFGVAMLLADVFFVRNLFGVFFVAAVGIGCLAIARKGSPTLAQTSLVFLAAQLGLSVFSRGDYLFTDVAQTGAGEMPSDVAQISAALFGPYWMWGGLIGGLSVLILLVGMGLFLRRTV